MGPLFARICVAIDDSDPSDGAATAAAALAQEGTQLELVHVLERDETSARSAAELLLSRAEDRVGTGVRVGHHILDGAPVPAIVKFAKEGGANLVVTGTHGRRGLQHLLLGSVAEGVVRTSPCPVLVVRNELHFTIRRILVAVEGPGDSQGIVAQAIRIGQRFQSTLVFLHALGLSDYAADESGYDVWPDRESWSTERYALFDRAAIRAEAARVPFEIILNDAKPADAIMHTLHEQGIDAVVMGTHARSGLARAFLGSTAEHVLRYARVPVFVIRA